MTVSYTKPDTNPIQDLAGHDAPALRSQLVTNITGDTTAPTLSSATVDRTTLTLNYNEALDTNSTPATTDFTVSVAGTNQTPSGVSVSGSSVTLTLGTRAVHGQTVTVSYTKGTNPIRDLAENDAAALSTQAVTNNTPLTPKTLPPAAVTSLGMVSNTGQAEGSGSVEFNLDLAQQFNTGASSHGYVLTGVDLAMRTISGTAPTLTVRILLGSVRGSEQGQLTRSGAWVQNGLTRFNAPAGGIQLVASRPYVVVFDVTGNSNADYDVGRTTADAEDSGGLSGWTLANTTDSRAWNSSGLWGALSGGNAVRMAVHGYEKLAPATIDLVRILSAPTYDADGDGVRDTFVQGDKILVDVEYNEPVTVTGTPRLRLQLGADGNTGAPVTGNRKQLNFESQHNGDRTLRFAYTVVASDTDADGVWVETNRDQVVFLPTGAAITNAHGYNTAELTRTGLPTTGDGNPKVDGTKTSADTGPRPTSATVNGATLEVTYDTALNSSVDTSELPYYFSVYGTELGGGHPNAYQHPSAVAFHATDNMKLVLTLGEAARAGDTVKLNFTLIGHEGLLKDTNDKVAPAFFDLAVTNNTAGTAGPAPSIAYVKARTLQLELRGPGRGQHAGGERLPGRDEGPGRRQAIDRGNGNGDHLGRDGHGRA